jgi:hypothetical protein
MLCPRCGRPVAVARPQCLYCGAPVSSLEATDRRAHPRPPADAAPGAPRLERVLLVVGLDGVEAERLRAAFSISPYEAEQWARRGGYHLHRSAAAEHASAERERLAAHGIPAFTFDEATVRDAAEGEAAMGGSFDGQRLRVRTGADTVEIAGTDLLLIVKGPITREHLPMETVRFARTATLEPGFRFHLHRREAARPLEIDPAAFDFGARREREGSLLEITGWVAALAESAPVDDGFRRVTPALAPAGPPAGPAARLEEALRTGAAKAPTAMDNVTQFRFYSAWRGAVERAVRSR